MNKETITKLVNDGNLCRHLMYLSGRWQDEREYENFADYTKNMADSVAEVIGAVSDPVGTKRPFGIKFTKDNEKFHLFLKSDGMYSWLALKRL